jgi:glutamate synthase domain-containing protein 2
VLKVMSKMGISTIASYTGAQIFEAHRPGPEVVDEVLHRHDEPPRRHRPGRDRPEVQARHDAGGYPVDGAPRTAR